MLWAAWLGFGEALADGTWRAEQPAPVRGRSGGSGAVAQRAHTALSAETETQLPRLAEALLPGEASGVRELPAFSGSLQWMLRCCGTSTGRATGGDGA